MRLAKNVKKIVKCEAWQLARASEGNQWCFMRWFIDLSPHWLKASHPFIFIFYFFQKH